MKICFMIPSLGAGGAERTVSYLSEEFVKKGDSVFIVTVINEVFYEINKKVLYRCIEVNGTNHIPSLVNRFICGIKRTLLVRKSIEQINPDVVFCILTDMAKYIVSTKHDYCLICSERTNPAALTRSAIKKKKKIYKKSDGVVFQTERAKDFFKKDIGDKGVVIQNAVSIDTSNIHRTAVKKKFTAVGRLIDAKDYPTMIKAFALFIKKYPEYTLEIFGSGPLENDLKVLISSLGLNHSVFLKGTVKEAVFTAIDSTAFLLSSKYEGMPNVLLEALALGIPCISTDCPNGPNEIISDGVNGFLVDIGDYVQFCECMRFVVENPQKMRTVTEKGMLINKTNSIDIISDKYRNYCIEIMNYRAEKEK